MGQAHTPANGQSWHKVARSNAFFWNIAGKPWLVQTRALRRRGGARYGPAILPPLVRLTYAFITPKILAMQVEGPGDT